MSDPSADEAASGPKAGGAAGPSGESAGATPPRGPDRRRLPAGVGLVLIAIAVVLIVTDPFAGSPKSGSGGVDNGAATALTTVSRRSLSAQTQVSGTLGYAGSSSIRVPSGTAPSAVSAGQAAVTNAEAMLATARATLASDSEALAGHRATLAAARAKEAVDCAGEAPRKAASAGSSPAGGNDSPGGSGLVRERRAGRLCSRSRTPPAPPQRSPPTARRSPRPKNSSRARSRTCPRRAPRPRSTGRARRSRRCRRSARSSGAGRACMRSAASRWCCCTARCSRRGRSSRGCPRARTSPS